MSSKVVVHFKNHKVIKGTVSDLSPNEDKFHLTDIVSGIKHLINFPLVKAIFFVKTFQGNPDQKRKEGFHTTHAFGLKTVVKFHDGEILYGFSEDYSPYTKGFYLYPASDSNNVKIFIPLTSIFEIKIGQDIDKSKYAKSHQKFLKKIVPKVVHVTLQVSIGEVIIEDVTMKIVETNQILTIPKGQGGVTVSLKPGIYTVEITYQTYKMTRQIEAATDKRFYRFDFQQMNQ